MLRSFVSAGHEHFGTDVKGIENTRRYLLEWLSFTHRYVPVGLLEVQRVGIQMKSPAFYARSDLEQLLASPDVKDWIRITEMSDDRRGRQNHADLLRVRARGTCSLVPFCCFFPSVVSPQVDRSRAGELRVRPEAQVVGDRGRRQADGRRVTRDELERAANEHRRTNHRIHAKRKQEFDLSPRKSTRSRLAWRGDRDERTG